MPTQEWSQIWHHARLEMDLLRASYVQHAYPRHSHDYYVICVVERGLQSFTHRGAKYLTPPGGVILINPGVAHTGEAVDERGFQMRCLYPTITHLQAAVFESTGHHQSLPSFGEVRVDDRWARDSILLLHRALVQETSALECESRFIWTLAQLIQRYAHPYFSEQRLYRERQAIQRARRYIEECFDRSIDLNQLAAHVSLSPYYLLRAFRAEVGMPPHAYQESLRIRRSQQLIRAGKPLAEVAAEVGFSSQSHLTQRFKQIIGVTPGQYAQQLGTEKWQASHAA